MVRGAIMTSPGPVNSACDSEYDQLAPWKWSMT